MSMDLKLSVLMSVYNESPVFLRKSWDSIKGQTYGNWELILVDDGSELAGTKQVLGEIGQAPRVKLVRTRQTGLTQALNIGLQHCSGDIIIRQDSDDWSAMNRLAAIAEVFATRGDVGLLGSSYYCVTARGKPLFAAIVPQTDFEIRRGMRSKNVFCHGAMAFRREIAQAIGGYRKEFECAQDYDFCLRALEKTTACQIGEPLYFLRKRETSISARRAHVQTECANWARAMAIVRQKGGPEEVEKLTAVIRSLPDNGENEASLDTALLAGSWNRALRLGAAKVMAGPKRGMALLKMFRAIAFILAPPLRQWLFR